MPLKRGCRCRHKAAAVRAELAQNADKALGVRPRIEELPHSQEHAPGRDRLAATPAHVLFRGQLSDKEIADLAAFVAQASSR